MFYLRMHKYRVSNPCFVTQGCTLYNITFPSLCSPIFFIKALSTANLFSILTSFPNRGFLYCVCVSVRVCDLKICIMHFGVWQVEMVSSFLCFFFKTRLAVQIISHKIQQPLLRWSVVVCVLPFWEVNIGCVESHWHVRGVTFASAERFARAPAARQLEISAGMQNLITTLIFTLSLSYSLCLCLRVSTSPPFSGTLSSLLRGAAHLHSWRDLLIPSFSPAPHSLHSYLLHFCIFSLYSSEIFFSSFCEGHHESSSTALPIPSKG